MRAGHFLIVGALACLVACNGGDGGTAPDAAASGSAGQSAQLPDACDVLREADLSMIISGTPAITEMPAASTEDVKVTNCTAASDKGNLSVGLLVRQQLNDKYLTPSAAQAEDLVANTAPGGPLEGMSLEKVDNIGESALWAPQVGQLNVFYRGGRSYFIITAMNTPNNKDASLALARQIIAKHP